MSAIRLRVRFVLAGVLLVATSAASSAWSAWAFRRVSLVVDATVRDSEQTTGATGTLAEDLEREDDALLLTLADETLGRRELERGRLRVQSAFADVDGLLALPAEREAAATLRRDVNAYHEAGDALVADLRDPGTRMRYHEHVNPLLRLAVGELTRIRDSHFRSSQRVAAWASDQATEGMHVLAAVFGGALFLSLLAAYHLARVVVLPIGELTKAVEAVRAGDFGRRVAIARRDELGQLADGFNRMADDLAEFRRANIGEVLRAKDTLEATLAALPDAVVVIDARGDVSSANARATIVMSPPGGAVARTLGGLPVPESVREAVRAVLRGEPAGGVPVDLSRAIVLSVGQETRKLLPRIVPVEGKGAVLLLSDVTELARLDEMRIELVAVASHELRTPLTTLRMTLLMLHERSFYLEARDRELLTTALLGVDQLATTVAEFLDLTRIEAGQLRLHLGRVDLVDLVGQAIAGIRASVDEARIILRLDVEQGLPERIRGDAARLGGVLSNLLDNAMKYTPSGGTIDVAVQNDDRGPGARVTITDSGPGVPVEFRQRVFDKFFRVEHQQRDVEQGVRGSGIGLYVAREIIVAHGGAIECVAGPEGRGARFVIRLPVDVRENDRAQARE